MTTFNIAVIFGPTLFGLPVLVTSPAPNGHGNGTGMTDMGLQNKVRLVCLQVYELDADTSLERPLRLFWSVTRIYSWRNKFSTHQLGIPNGSQSIRIFYSYGTESVTPPHLSISFHLPFGSILFSLLHLSIMP
jgi:hypothetical protein